MPFLDRCIFKAVSGGTESFVVASAVLGFQTPEEAGAVFGLPYGYTAQSSDLTQWEVGVGPYGHSGPSVERATVLFNSNGNTSPVNFTAAPQVLMTPLATQLMGPWQYINATLYPDGYQASPGDRLLVDTLTAGTVVIMLPADPNDGDSITVYDFLGNFSTNPCIVSFGEDQGLFPQTDGALNSWLAGEGQSVINYTPFDCSEIVWQEDFEEGFFVANSLANVAFQPNIAYEGPNSGWPVAILQAAIGFGVGTDDNIDIALRPYNGGAILALVPDGESDGGNKRGEYAVDLQLAIDKGSPTTVASGTYAYCEGNGNTASGEASHAEGARTIASELCSHAEGNGTTASGGDGSHSEGSGTLASGESSHAEGVDTTASGTISHSEGNACTASGQSSHAEGFLTTASGLASHSEGTDTVADAAASQATGQNSWTRGIFAAQAYANGYFSANGDNQYMRVGARGTTNDGETAVVLCTDGSNDPGTTNQLVLVDNESVFFDVFVFGKDAGQNDFLATQIQSVIMRGTGVGSVVLNTPNTISTYSAGGGSGWTVTLSADTSNGALQISVVGQDGTQVNWNCEIRTRELVL